MHAFRRIAFAGCLGSAAFAAQAQMQAPAPGVTIYGTIDQYLNYLHSSSGARVRSLEDGAFLRSRLGFRGAEDLGDGYFAKFQLEFGFNGDTGAQADATRSFDRQSWVGLGGTKIGEFRVGRQNGPIFARGGYVDYTTRTLGSVINAFGVPSRYDNDLSYISPRWAGVMVEAHAALPEQPSGNQAMIYQGAIDYASTSYRLGYMGLRGRPAADATVDKSVVYDNVYANWMYGQGTVYLAYVRSNNNTANATSNNGTAILGNVGGFNAGTNPDLENFYKIYQVSADWQATGQLRVGALWGVIRDESGRDRGAKGGSVGAYYDLSKRTTLLAIVQTLRNDENGGWRPVGSAGLKTTFTNPDDINGRTINGVHLGVVHRF